MVRGWNEGGLRYAVNLYRGSGGYKGRIATLRRLLREQHELIYEDALRPDVCYCGDRTHKQLVYHQQYDCDVCRVLKLEEGDNGDS